MTRIILDAKAAEQLRAARGPVTLCDPDGNPIQDIEARPFPDREPVLSKEEWARRMAEPGGMTTAQLVEHLKNLGPT